MAEGKTTVQKERSEAKERMAKVRKTKSAERSADLPKQPKQAAPKRREGMQAIDEEVRQRVLKDNEAYLGRLQGIEDKAYSTEKMYREMIDNHKPLLTIDQFNLLRKCLHQKGIAASQKDFDEAFNLIQTKKLQLTGQK